MRYDKKMDELLKHDEWYVQNSNGYFPTEETPEDYLSTIREMNNDLLAYKE